mmetsp:Transcript_45672/g.97316  ORF Transcript_45672/g.97316 Transcript_45672/m.97316 type:complete len:318 (+) Transcript_45672:347-1300(+)
MAHPPVPRVDESNARLTLKVDLARRDGRRGEDRGEELGGEHHRPGHVLRTHGVPVCVGVAVAVRPVDVAQVVVDERPPQRRVHQRRLHERLVRHVRQLDVAREADGRLIVQQPLDCVPREHDPLRTVEELPAVGRRRPSNVGLAIDDRAGARVAAAGATVAEEVGRCGVEQHEALALALEPGVGAHLRVRVVAHSVDRRELGGHEGAPAVGREETGELRVRAEANVRVREVDEEVDRSERGQRDRERVEQHLDHRGGAPPNRSPLAHQVDARLRMSPRDDGVVGACVNVQQQEVGAAPQHLHESRHRRLSISAMCHD